MRPDDGSPFDGDKAYIKLEWTSSHTLKPEEYFEVTVRWTHDGALAAVPYRVQTAYYFVDEAIHLQADQETDRIYYWSVRLVRKVTDAEGTEDYLPISENSEEWSFYWR